MRFELADAGDWIIGMIFEEDILKYKCCKSCNLTLRARHLKAQAANQICCGV